MSEIVITSRDGRERRVVDTTNWALWTSSNHPEAKRGLYLPWNAIQKCRDPVSGAFFIQPKVDGSSVPTSVKRQNFKQSDGNMHRLPPCLPGRPLPPIPIPGHDDIFHSRPLPVLPRRLNFPCTFGRALPPIPESNRPKGSWKPPRQMPTIPESGRFKFPVQPLPPFPLDLGGQKVGRPLPPVPSGPGCNLWHTILPGAILDNSANVQLTYEDRRINAISRARKIKDNKLKKGEELIAMDKDAALNRVEKLRKKREEQARQSYLPDNEYSSIFDVINEKIRDMFAVILNDIRRDIVEVNKMLQYKIEERDAYIDALEYQRDLLTIKKTGVVLSIYKENDILESIERLIRCVNTFDHMYFQEDYQKIMQRQKYKTDIIELIKLKKKRLKKLCIKGNIKYNDDIQVMINLIRNLYENSKSIKILREIFIQQCIDSDEDWQMQLDSEVQELAEEPNEIDPETLARIKMLVNRTAEDFRFEEQEKERKEQEVYYEKVKYMKEMLDKTKQDYFTHLSVRRELGERSEKKTERIKPSENNVIGSFDKIKRKLIKHDREKWAKLDEQCTKHAKSLDKKRVNRLRWQQRRQTVKEILFLKRIENSMINTLYRRTRTKVKQLSKRQRDRFRRLALGAKIKLRAVKRTLTSAKQKSLESRHVVNIRKTFRQMKEHICSTKSKIKRTVKKTVANAVNKVTIAAKEAGNKTSKVARCAGRKISKGLVQVGIKADRALNKVYWQYTQFMKPRPLRTKRRFYFSRTVTHKRIIGDNPIARFFDYLLTSLYFRNAMVIKLRKNAVVAPKVKDIGYEDSPSYAAFTSNKDLAARIRWQFTKAGSRMNLEEFLTGTQKPDIPLLDAEVNYGSETYLQYERKLGRKLSNKEKRDLDERVWEMRKDAIEKEIFGHVEESTIDFAKVLKKLQKGFPAFSLDVYSENIENMFTKTYSLFSSEDSFLYKNFNESLQKLSNLTGKAKKSSSLLLETKKNSDMNERGLLSGRTKRSDSNIVPSSRRRWRHRYTLRQPETTEFSSSESDLSIELKRTRRKSKKRHSEKTDINTLFNRDMVLTNKKSETKQNKSFPIRKWFRNNRKGGQNPSSNITKRKKDKVENKIVLKHSNYVKDTKSRNRKRVIGSKTKKSIRRRANTFHYKRPSSSGSPGYNSQSSVDTELNMKKKQRKRPPTKKRKKHSQKENNISQTRTLSKKRHIMKTNKKTDEKTNYSSRKKRSDKQNSKKKLNKQMQSTQKNNSQQGLSIINIFRQLKEKRRQKKAESSKHSKRDNKSTTEKRTVSIKDAKDENVRKPDSSLWSRLFIKTNKDSKQKKSGNIEMQKINTDSTSSEICSAETDIKEMKRKRSILSNIFQKFSGLKNTDMTMRDKKKSKREKLTNEKNKKHGNSLSKNEKRKLLTKRKTYVIRKQGISRRGRNSSTLSWKELHRHRNRKPKKRQQILKHLKANSSYPGNEVKRKPTLRRKHSKKLNFLNILPKGLFGKKIKKNVKFGKSLVQMPEHVSQKPRLKKHTRRVSGIPVRRVIGSKKKRRSSIHIKNSLKSTFSSTSDSGNARRSPTNKLRAKKRRYRSKRTKGKSLKKATYNGYETKEKQSLYKRFVQNSFKRLRLSKVKDKKQTSSTPNVPSSDSTDIDTINSISLQENVRQNVENETQSSAHIADNESRQNEIRRILSEAISRLRKGYKTRAGRTAVETVTPSSSSSILSSIEKSPSTQALRGSLSSVNEPKDTRCQFKDSRNRLYKRKNKRKERDKTNNIESSSISTRKRYTNSLRDFLQKTLLKSGKKLAEPKKSSSEKNKPEYRGLIRRLRHSFGNLLKKKKKRKKEKIGLHDVPNPSLKARLKTYFRILRNWRNPDETTSSPSISSYESHRPGLKPKNSWKDYSSSESSSKPSLRRRMGHSYRRIRMKRKLRRQSTMIRDKASRNSTSWTPRRFRSFFREKKKKKSSPSLNRNLSSCKEEKDIENNIVKDPKTIKMERKSVHGKFMSFFKRLGKSRKDKEKDSTTSDTQSISSSDV